MSKPKIGFIGLGLMGRAMVSCLQDAEYTLVVLGNRDRTGVEEALTRGATEAATARELTEASDIVMICVGNSDQVESRVYAEDGILAGAKPGQVVIDFGTSLPASTLKIGADLAAKSAHYLDAPLGRTPAHAKDGLLNIMCAGDETAFAEAEPVLDVLAENVFHLGKLGSGHTVKLLNNYFGMTAAMAMAEVFAVADAAGVDRTDVFNIMAAGPNYSPMMGFMHNYTQSGQIDLAFSVENAAKDLGYYSKMASDLGLHSRMSGCAENTLCEARDGGEGGLMIPEMIDWMTRNIGKEKT